MRTLLRKARSRRAETLTETLTALLVVGLASAALAGMVGASARMNAEAMERDEALYAAVTRAETGTGDSAEGRVTVTVGDKTSAFNVAYYGGDGLNAYRVTEGGDGP